MFLNLIRLWTGPLPPQHIWISSSSRPKQLTKIIRLYFRKWIVHPLKRKIAKYYLAILKSLGLKVIAITGSAGKTTTKEMLLSILSLEAPTVASVANIDPVYNIPTTILNCTPKTKYLILEMGIEYIGEMDFYTWLAQPDVAIITNVNLTHTEFLKNIATIAREKGKIGKFAMHLIVSEDPNIEVNTHGQMHLVKPGHFQLKLIGDHLQLNAALAAKAAQILGISEQKIRQGLQSLTAPPHRLQLIETNNFSLIDDSYNANPLAVKASIDTLMDYCRKQKKTPVLVLSQMNELGEFEKSAHQEIGEYVEKYKITNFFTIGPATVNLGKHFENTDELTDYLKKFLRPNHVALIKGSRGWHLERVVAALQ
jgi:UDP-N-acetylmuramoyl-tripeptide--D-alanyl-D-alanine ligase